jgi:hypothetical protein
MDRTQLEHATMLLFRRMAVLSELVEDWELYEQRRDPEADLDTEPERAHYDWVDKKSLESFRPLAQAFLDRGELPDARQLSDALFKKEA